MAILWPERRLKMLDFPTFGRPMMVTRQIIKKFQVSKDEKGTQSDYNISARCRAKRIYQEICFFATEYIHFPINNKLFEEKLFQKIPLVFSKKHIQ
jgi:hypothetical protein